MVFAGEIGLGMSEIKTCLVVVAQFVHGPEYCHKPAVDTKLTIDELAAPLPLCSEHLTEYNQLFAFGTGPCLVNGCDGQYDPFGCCVKCGDVD